MFSIARILAVLVLVGSTALASPIPRGVSNNSPPLISTLTPRSQNVVECAIGDVKYSIAALKQMRDSGNYPAGINEATFNAAMRQCENDNPDGFRTADFGPIPNDANQKSDAADVNAQAGDNQQNGTPNQDANAHADGNTPNQSNENNNNAPSQSNQPASSSPAPSNNNNGQSNDQSNGTPPSQNGNAEPDNEDNQNQRQGSMDTVPALKALNNINLPSIPNNSNQRPSLSSVPVKEGAKAEADESASDGARQGSSANGPMFNALAGVPSRLGGLGGGKETCSCA
ncbi:hypothetical protein R3P38DRAFT_3038818 [Favolaschia claudopus]|uniref:Uncharacterized protein n=1 Tax=Favolaschia claudopus TaxID=2862362 RepID=A0AAW0A9Z1_9AGAR